MKHFKWISALLFVAFAFSLLIVGNSDYLYAVSEHSLFIHHTSFFKTQMAVPGGLIAWAGCYLTQFFHFPVIGALMLIALWLLSYWLTLKAFNIKTAWGCVAAMLPILALLASVTGIGYWLYYNKIEGYWFKESLGYLLTIIAIGTPASDSRGCQSRGCNGLAPMRITRTIAQGLASTRITRAKTQELAPPRVTRVGATLGIILWSVVGYYIAGWWALLATLVMVCQRGTDLLAKIAGVVSIAIVPLVAYHTHAQMRLDEAWIYGFPLFQNDTCTSWPLVIPFAVIVITLLALALFTKEPVTKEPVTKEPVINSQPVTDSQPEAKAVTKQGAKAETKAKTKPEAKPSAKAKTKQAKSGKPITAFLPYPILLIAFAIVYTTSFRDENYHREIRMYRAAMENQWTDVLKEAAQATEPTREIVVLKDLALMQKGIFAAQYTKYSNSGPLPKKFDHLNIHLTQTCGPLLYLHYGRANLATRWAIENEVEYGLDVDQLKCMVLSALISEEWELADKHLRQLEATDFQGEWTKEYRQYADKKSTQGCKELAFAKELHYSCGNILDTDQGMIEKYLVNYFSHLQYTENKLLSEVILNFTCIGKDTHAFWPRFAVYVKLHQGEPMPTLFQEAAILYGNLEKLVDISHMPFNEGVRKRYADFRKTSQSLLKQGKTEQQVGAAMKATFGDTFWWNYYFLRHVPSY